MERGVTSFEKRYGALRQYRATERSRLLIATPSDSRKRRLLRILEPPFFERVSSRAFAASEIEKLQGLSHPRLVHVLERGTTRKGKEFVVIEHIRGKTLAKLLEENGALDVDETITLVLPLLEALSVAHDAGLVHSNIHPGNVNIGVTTGMQRQITLLDIGFYARFGAFGSLEGGEFAPHHLAPEQIQQQEVGAASDIYALGLCLFEMLTGNHPFWGTTTEEVLFSQLYEPAPRLAEFNTELTFPGEIETIVERCLAIEPGNRWASVDELHRALVEASRSVVPVVSSPVRPAEAARLADEEATQPPPQSPPLPARAVPPPIPAAARATPPAVPAQRSARSQVAAMPSRGGLEDTASGEPNPFKREDSGHGLEPGERVRFRLARGIVADLSDAFSGLLPAQEPGDFSRLSVTQHGYSRDVEERIDELFLRLAQFLLQFQRLELQLESFGVMLSGRPLDQSQHSTSNLWYLLFLDGVRELRFERGVTIDELRRFVRLLKERVCDDLALMDDALTLHWEADIPHIQLRATDEFLVLPTPSRSRIIETMFPRRAARGAAPPPPPEEPRVSTLQVEIRPEDALTYRELVFASIHRDPSEEFRAVLTQLIVEPRGVEARDVFLVYCRVLDYLIGLGDTARTVQSLDELARVASPAERGDLWSIVSARLSSPAVLRKLMTLVEHGTGPRREQVARLLPFLGPEAAELILSASEFVESPEAWLLLRDALVRTVDGHPGRLLKSLRHGSSRVVGRAVQVLGRIESEDVPKYLALVARHQEPSVRAEVLGAQIARNPPTRLGLIGAALGDDAPLVRGRAMELLRREDPAVVVPLLASLLTTGHLARWGVASRQLFVETLRYFESGELYSELERIAERGVRDPADSAAALALDCLRAMKTVGAKKLLRRFGGEG